ncbi:MAG: TIGR02147 family protein [Fibrobacterota bacterium]
MHARHAVQRAFRLTGKNPAQEQADVPPVVVFDYADYHEYLKDWIEDRKTRGLVVSYQWLATRMGLKSRSFLRLVSIGEKDLSQAAALKLSQAMGHTAREEEYFVILVALNNSSDLEEKNHHLTRLAKVARPARKTMLSVQQYDLFNKWFVIPLWELVTLVDFRGDWKYLSQQLDPPITPAEAKYAVELLRELGLIEPKGDLYVQKDPTLTTQEELRSQSVRNFQAATMDLAQQALTRHPPIRRHISTLTLGVDETGYLKIVERIRNFREELVTIAQQHETVDRVFQFNLQFFPLSRVPVERRTLKDVSQQDTETVRIPGES